MEKIRVLHINTFSYGGAAKAAFRIHKALLNIGIDSYIYRLDSNSTHHREKSNNPKGLSGKMYDIMRSCSQRGLESLLRRIFGVSVKTPVSTGQGSMLNRKVIENLNPDVINLHWICGNFISISDIKWLSKYKLVWTLHDSWAFTGGCHIPYNCTKWQTGCEKCDLLGKKIGIDLAKSIFTQKQKQFGKADIKIIGVSSWLADCARRSLLFQDKDVFVVHNTLDQECYKPKNQTVVREILGLPQEKKIILFGAMSSTSDENKGFKFLYTSIKHLVDEKLTNDIELMVFGSDEPDNPPEFGVKVHYMGSFSDDLSISMLYSAADIMVVPSRSESFPNTVLEALSCGTPVAAFRIGGIPDQIDHKRNGYLAKPFDSTDLARGINFILEDDSRWQEMSLAARQKVVEFFNENRIAREYVKVYESFK